MYFWPPANGFTYVHTYNPKQSFAISVYIKAKCLLEIYDFKKKEKKCFPLLMFILISSFAVVQLVLRKEVPNARCQQGVVCLELCKPQATPALI